MTRLHHLTRREIEVLRLLSRGESNKRIAQELYISVNTVERHLKNIYAKLDVHSRTGAMLFYLTENHWIP